MDEDVANATEALLPSAPRGTIPYKPSGNGNERSAAFQPITIVPQQGLDRVSRHGAVVVATLATTSKLFDIVLRPDIVSSPITSVKQFAGVVAGSWVFAKTTIDILETHGIKSDLMLAAQRDSAILVRAVVLLMVRKVVKLEGFAVVGNIMSLFQFVKVAGALAESQNFKAAGFLDEIASIPMKVFSAASALLSNAIDMRLREAVALAIAGVLSEAKQQLSFADTGIKLTTKNVEQLFYESYSLLTRYVRMRLGVPNGVDARDVLLQWRQSV